MGRFDDSISSRAILGMIYEALQQALSGIAWVNTIGMTINSNQASETYKWLGQVPALREWIAGRHAKGLRDNGFTIANKKFEATLEVMVDDLRRDKTGQLRLRIGELADRAQELWAILLSTLINNGGGSTNGLCYDGQYFFDTDHSEGASGAQKNLLAAGDYGALDIATATNPTPAEFAAALIKVIPHFYTMVDDQGQPINGSARKFVVMTNVAMWGAALQAVRQNLLSTGNTAIDNPLRGVMESGGISIEVICNPRYTGTATFDVYRVDGRTKPFILQEEEGVTTSAIAEGSEEEFKNDRHLYGLKAIRNVGYGMWQHAIRATFS